MTMLMMMMAGDHLRRERPVQPAECEREPRDSAGRALGLTDESAEGSRDAERAGAASWLLIFDWTAGAASVFEASRGLASFDEMPPPTAAGGSPWGLTSGDAGLASVDAESARRTRTMFDRSFIFDICAAATRCDVVWESCSFDGEIIAPAGVPQLSFDRWVRRG